MEQRLIDANAIKLEKGFFEKVDNVPKFYEWLCKQPTVDAVPVEWIKAKIESLKLQDNEFLTFAAMTMQAMLNCYGVEGERRSE